MEECGTRLNCDRTLVYTRSNRVGRLFNEDRVRFAVWRGGLSRRTNCLGLLFGANFSVWRAAYPRLRGATGLYISGAQHSFAKKALPHFSAIKSAGCLTAEGLVS